MKRWSNHYPRLIGFQPNKVQFKLKQLKVQLKKHLKKQEYSTKDLTDTCVNVSGKASFDTVSFPNEDNNNFFASSKKQIVKVDTRFDGYTLSLILCLSFLYLTVGSIWIK